MLQEQSVLLVVENAHMNSIVLVSALTVSDSLQINYPPWVASDSQMEVLFEFHTWYEFGNLYLSQQMDTDTIPFSNGISTRFIQLLVSVWIISSRFDPKKTTNPRNPRKIFKFPENFGNYKKAVQIWAHNSSWAPRTVQSKFTSKTAKNLSKSCCKKKSRSNWKVWTFCENYNLM